MSKISNLDIACEHLARRHRHLPGSKPVSDEKRSQVSNLVANRLSSYLHRSITRKSTEGAVMLFVFRVPFKQPCTCATIPEGFCAWEEFEDALQMQYCS